MTDQPPRAPVPPFSYDEAVQKVRMAENAWNGRDPAKVALAYTPDTKWRNRSEFLNGRAEVEAFLTRKWATEDGYRLIKEIWAHSDDKIAVRFCYEYHDADGKWFRAHGNENWVFDALGYMAQRHASINDVPISESERLFHWAEGTPRPDDHPGLTELGL
ncbi:MAG: nuclear transport factor 2 family protein [Sulfitobacter sp.]